MSEMNTYHSVLENVPLSELKSLRVAVKRNNITSASPNPFERDIEDPRNIIPCVHYRKDTEHSHGIFDREGIIVNQEKRSVRKSSSRERSQSLNEARVSHRNRGRSPRRRSSRERYLRRSRSKDSRRSGSPENDVMCSTSREDDYKRSQTPTHRGRTSSPRFKHSDDRRMSRSGEGTYRRHTRSPSPKGRTRSPSPRRRSSEYKSRSSKSPKYLERRGYLERHERKSVSGSRNKEDKRRSRSPYGKRAPRSNERERTLSDRRCCRSSPSSTHRCSSPFGKPRCRSPHLYDDYFHPTNSEIHPPRLYWRPDSLISRLPVPGMPRFFPPPQAFGLPHMSEFPFRPRFPSGLVPLRPRLPVYNSRRFLTLHNSPTASAKPSDTENNSGSVEKNDENVEKVSGNKKKSTESNSGSVEQNDQ